MSQDDRTRRGILTDVAREAPTPRLLDMRTSLILLSAALTAGCAHGPALRHPAEAPIFPYMLRAANVEGTTTFRVTVNPSGLADTASLRVLNSSHELFTRALRNALPRFEWQPARNWLGRARASEHTYVVRWTFLRGATRDSSLSEHCPESVGDTTVVCTTFPIRERYRGDPWLVSVEPVAQARDPVRTATQRSKRTGRTRTPACSVALPASVELSIQ